MRVLIFENDAAGHRLQHVRSCVQAIGDLDVEVVLATSVEGPDTDEFRVHVAPVRERITIDASFAAGGGSAFGSATTRVAACRAAMERHRPDHVYTLYADGFAQVAGAGRLMGRGLRQKGTELEGILMRGRFAYPSASWRDAVAGPAWLAATVLSPFDVLHFLDPIPYERILERGGSLATRARLIPEPVEPATAGDRAAARRMLDLPLDGRIVCCPGWLDARKGVDKLIRAFAEAGPALRPDDRLLLVGRVDPVVRAALDQARDFARGGRILLHEGVVSDEHLHRAIAASDVVATPYPRAIGSSGIVARAVALERMVLASDFGWVGMVTRRFRLGLTCDCRSEAPIARALPAALEAAGAFQPTPAARRFVQFHTQANYERHLSRRLRQRLGVPADEAILTWDWVLEATPPDTQGLRERSGPA